MLFLWNLCRQLEDGQKKKKSSTFFRGYLDAIERIEMYTSQGKDEFLNDQTIQDATLF